MPEKTDAQKEYDDARKELNEALQARTEMTDKYALDTVIPGQSMKKVVLTTTTADEIQEVEERVKAAHERFNKAEAGLQAG